MKRLLSLLLAGLLLLSGCAEQSKAPTYDAAPSLIQAGITIGGKALSGIYAEGEEQYLRLDEFAEALGGSISIAEGKEIYSATLTLGEQTHTFGSGPEGARYTGTEWYQPMKDLLPLLKGYHAFEDPEQNHTYYTAYSLAKQIAKGKEVPTLMYHAVSDQCWGIPALFVSPSTMEEHLKYLADNGYTTVTFEDLGRIEEIEKPVLLTFDDGYDDNYTELYPLLKKYNAKATIFLIVDLLGQEHYLTKEQVQEMNASGLVSFQSHTMTHEFLSTRTEEQLVHELYRSKIELARLLGKECFVIAYPSGKWSEQSLKATKEHYQFGLLSGGGTYETGTDQVKVPRFYVDRYIKLGEFKSMID